MIDNPTPLARIRFNNNTYNLTYDKQNLFAGFSLKTQAYYLFFNTKSIIRKALSRSTVIIKIMLPD